MSKKKATLVSENVIRRWGKLANMPALTENFLDSALVAEDEGLDDEMAAAEDEVVAGEEEMEAGDEAEVSVEEQEAVERIVAAVVDAIAGETGVEIEVEGGADDEAAMDDMDVGMDASDDLDIDADEEMDDADAAMRNPYSRKDLGEARKEKPGDDMRKGAEKRGAEGTKKKTSGKGRGEKKGDDAYANNRKDETLDIDLIDDENLTEAVLKRVVERLLRHK